ncbi:MAG: hypothetical protein NTX25_18080 [Proteobacteria bacterium]|nr:hypothetical protein [Pseudomonadota bacterium]
MEVAQEPKKKGRSAVAQIADDLAEGQDGRAGAQLAASKKIRLTLQEDDNVLLSQFQIALKDRGIKGVELSDIIAEALATVPKEWWDAKLEELTPFEYKLHAALENPELRAKLMSLLDTTTKS